MLEYIVTSMTRLATAIGLNLPSYTINYSQIICQATGRRVVPLLPHMTPRPPQTPPPPHIVPRKAIIHPIQPEPEHIHYLVTVVLKEKPVEVAQEAPREVPQEVPQEVPVELPAVKKVSDLTVKPIKMAGVVIPVPVVEKLPVVVPIVEKLPVIIKLPAPVQKPVVKNLPVRNLRPDHMPIECSGCEKHPLMSPQIYRMMIGTRRWGDMLYDGVI